MNHASLDEVANFINGYAFKPSDWNGSGKKIIRIQNLTDKSKPFNRTDTEVPEKYFVKKGNILVSWSATLDIFEWNYDETALLNQHIFKVEFKEDIIDKQYFKYILKNVVNSMLKYSHGSTMKHIVRSDFLKTRIPLPSLPEQKRIAEILDKADSIRQKRKESIALLDEFLRSVFLNMFGDPVRNEKGFKVVKIEEITDAIKDGPHVSPVYANKGIPILSTRNIRPGKLILEDVKYVSPDTYFELTKRFNPQKGDVLMTKGGTTGYAKAVNFDFKFCVWVHIAVLRPKSEINPLYLEHALNSDYCYSQSQKYTHGIANKDLGLTRIAKIHLLHPPLSLQTQFAKIVEQVEATKAKMEESLKEMDNQFNGLLQKVFK